MATAKKIHKDFTFRKDHYSILVADINRSSDFYGGVLGLRQIDNAGLGSKFRWYELSDKTQIHLIEGEGGIIPLPKAIHFALNTTDFDGFKNLLQTLSLSFENWAGESGAINTRPDGIRQLYLQDPDGHWVEINDNS